MQQDGPWGYGAAPMGHPLSQGCSQKMFEEGFGFWRFPLICPHF